MDRKLNLTKGQEVVIRYINDRARYKKDCSIENIDDWTGKGVVAKVGRKYIEVKVNGNFIEKFEIEYDYVQKTNMGSPDYKLYLSKEEIIEEINTESLYRDIQNYFSGYGRNNNRFSLNQLNRIMDIIKESEEN